MSIFRHHAPDAHDSVTALISRLADLTVAEGRAGSEAYRDRLLDDMEVVTLGIAGTRALTLEECRQKLDTLRARLSDMLDTGVPAEAVTLALVASVSMDLAQLVC